MEEDDERDRTEEGFASDDAKSDPKSSHVRIMQPSLDLNRYIVDKFHPPSAKSKHAPFESIDLSLYKPSARCLAFCTSENRLLFWITAFAQRYYELLTRQSAGYKVIWREQDGYSSPSKCDKLVIHLVEETSTSEDILVVITIFTTTGRIQVQGKKIEDWSTHEFPVLHESVNKLSKIENFSGISSVQDKSIFASSLHNFFANSIHFVAEDEIPSSNTTDGLAQKEVAITTNTALSAPPAEPLTITPNRLRTISSLRDTLGQLEADFTQFQIISSGDLQQMKDKMVRQDNLLKLQKQAIDEISSDLSLQVKLLQDMLSQQSTQIKKLQEENQSLQKKHTKTVQSNLALKEQHDGLLTEVNFLKEQVRALWEKPLDTPDNTETTTKDPHAILEASEPTEENPLPKPPTEDNIVPNGQAPLQKGHSGNNDPTGQLPPITVKSNTAVFLCDSNGKFLNKRKLFKPQQEHKYFRCPKVEHARDALQNALQEHPELIVIHTGTNNLTPTTPIDTFTSDISALVTEASTKFSKSKIIYSTLLPRADIPSHIITKINDQLINGCSKLPNVHLVTHTNVFSKGLEALHDDKHLKRRHIGLFAANLVDAIRGRTRPPRSPSSHDHLPRQTSQPQSTPFENYASYSDVVKNFSNSGHRTLPSQRMHQPLPQHQPPPPDYLPPQIHQSASGAPPVTKWQLPANPENGKDPPVDIPRELISLLRLIKSYV